MIFCRYCGKEIHEAAPNCPHCGGVQKPVVTSVVGTKDGGKLWLSITSLVFGIVGTLAWMDDATTDKETLVGIGMFAVAGLVLGGISLSKQKPGKGLAIAGVVLSSIALFALLGSIA